MKYAGLIATVLAAGAFVAWLAPEGAGPAAERAQADAPQVDETLAVAQGGGWGGGDVVLERESDGHFYADVEIEGRSTRMLVDTGASVVALTGEDADSLGVPWSMSDSEAVARGASGPVEGVRVTLDRVRLGDLEARGVRAVVIPEGLPVSLLGQSFLAQVPRVEMGPETMTLGGGR